MTHYYPVMLALHERLAVIIGGGSVAEQKLAELRNAGARIRVVSPRATPLIESLSRTGAIEWIPRAYESGDLAGARIAIAATDDADVNARVWAEAEERGVLLNAVDDVRHCHFIAPSVHRRGDIVVAVSTGGACPALAVRLRERVGRMIGPEHATLARIAGALRGEIARRVPVLEARRALWYRIVDANALDLLRQGQVEAASNVIETIIQEHETPATSPSAAVLVGSVALVGAGPGDPTLITVRGLELLERADVVVHDHLVSPDLVARASPRARVFSVGKHGHGPATAQSAINALLVREAQRGRSVVRLKGGDPFVFGRGAEEAEHLRNAGIPFEVIPGVTSATAAPLAAGIPVTHRALASGFVVVTGHESAVESQLDWSAVGRIPTIVVLMGLRALPAIVEKLRDAGLHPDTPAALVSRATLPDQRVVAGKLEEIETLAAAAALEQPATLIVGRVATLALSCAAP